MKNWLRILWSRLRATAKKEQFDRDFDEELKAHLELLIDEGRLAGLSSREAEREALRKLGRPLILLEDHQEQRGLPLLDTLSQDLRYGVRTLWKSPAFTLIVTLSLGLGIGANTALFSLVDDLLLRSLPVRDADRLVKVELVASGLGTKKGFASFPAPVFDALRARTDILSEVVGFNRLDRPSVTLDGHLEPALQVERVSSNFFRDLGVNPVHGRTPDASDDAVAVLSDRYWRSRFARRSDVLGRALTLDGQVFTIVGVAPPGFIGLSVENSIDLWLAARTPPPPQAMIARLNASVTPSHAQAALQTPLRQLGEAQTSGMPWNDAMQVTLLPAGKGLSQLRAQYDRPLLALLVLVSLVLLITCTNVSNLLMVRNTARRRELSLRISLGASRSRVVMQYLVESGLLALMGGLLALGFARWGVSITLSMLPLPSVPQGLAFEIDGRVLGFTGLLAIVSALLFGLAPAWNATGVDLTAALKSNSGGTSSRGNRRMARWLVASQVALTVLLLVGAGLFVQTLRNLTHLDVGFDPKGLLQVSIDTRGAGYGQGQVGDVHRLLLERVAAIPGVRSVAAIRNAVLRNSGTRSSITMPDLPLGPEEGWDSAEVGPAFFETMGIRVVHGRVFTAEDFERQSRVKVISEAFAKHYFPNQDPIGRLGGLIIGVVADTKLFAMRKENAPFMYDLARKEPDRLSALEVRTDQEPGAVSNAIVHAVRSIHPRLLIEVRTMQQEIGQNVAKERIVAATSSFFSLLALLLASIGIFGVASSTVAQRTNELGIRMALGAGPWSVIRESLRETMLVFGAGLVAGTMAAVTAVQVTKSFISELLFGLDATDTANIAAAVFVMAAIALIACILPARRATRIDPLAAIRHE
jgi:predicted permease